MIWSICDYKLRLYENSVPYSIRCSRVYEFKFPLEIGTQTTTDTEG